MQHQLASGRESNCTAYVWEVLPIHANSPASILKEYVSTRSDTHFLSDLATANYGAAWQAFLRKYTSLILHVVRRHEADESRVMDMYLYVCEKLSESHFHRLRKFRTDGPATFSTWLTAVTRNLCIDWHRHMHGRYRPSAAISQLSDLEALVFTELYEHGKTKAECVHALPDKYAHVTEHEVEQINARIHSLLTPTRRWKLVNRQPTVVPLDEDTGVDRGHPEVGTDNNPQAQALSEEALARLEQAIARLDVDERLAIRLRFQEDLSYAEIAQALGISSKYRVRVLLNRGLSRLRRELAD